MLRYIEIQDVDLTESLEPFEYSFKRKVEQFLIDYGDPREIDREWIFINLIKIATEEDLGSYDWLINIISLFAKFTDSSSNYDGGLFEFMLHQLAIKVGISQRDIASLYYMQLEQEHG